MAERSSRRRFAGVLAVVVFAAACTTSGFTMEAPTAAQNAPVRTGAVTDHVIVVSIDGLRPDAIERFGARTLLRLMEAGTYSLSATTILPSRTLPSHTSMLTGAAPEVHGITWNTDEVDEHGHVATPTIFAAAHDAGFSTAAFFSKSKFRHLAVPGTLDYVQVPRGWPGKWTSERTVDDAEAYLRRARPSLMFVHLAEPDFVGHAIGWMTAPYGWAVREADEELGELLAAADAAFGAGEYTVLITADHGGHGRDHGSEDPRDVTIPWIAWGEGVERGAPLPDAIRTMDTAATALWLLGVEASDESVGRPVAAAFEPMPAAPALAAAGG